MIESVNNERIKEVSKLKDKKYQQEKGMFLVEGEHLVEEANKKGLLLEVYALGGTNFEYGNITYVSESVMKKLTTLTNIPKIIGVAKMFQNAEISGNVLMLDAVQDPGNMGTIIRSALAFNIGTIIVGTGSVSIYNPKVVRASEGALFHVNILEADILSIIPHLKRDGYKVYATFVDGGVSLKSINFAPKSAIIVGNEGAGVSPSLKSLADEKLYIDISDNMESLNVGVATSIILYELNK